jgi:hypothetical protein
MYLRLPGDGILAPQHVAVFKPYAHFAILWYVFVCDVISMLQFHNKHPHIPIKKLFNKPRNILSHVW